MADEISIRLTLKCENGGYYFNRPFSDTFTQTTAGQFANTQSVGTTYEALALPADIATRGYYLIINQDPTNFVEMGVEVAAAFYPLDKIRPGGVKLAYAAAGVTPYVKADTAACKIEVAILSA